MGLFDRIRESLTGEKYCPIEHLESFKRLGEQVYSLHVELAENDSPRALALVQAARSVQTMADAMLGDAFSEDKPKPVPIVSHDQADVWYGMIPDIMIGARQEASFPNSTRLTLPIRLGNQVDGPEPCPVAHLSGLRRAAAGMEELLSMEVETARAEKERFRDAILLYEEARTRKQSGDSIVGTITNGRRVSAESHEDAEKQYWMALTSYILVAQGLKAPDLLKGVRSGTDFEARPQARKCKLDSSDIWKVTSHLAIRDIKQAGEWEQAVHDLEEHWELFNETPVEREYESTVEELLKKGDIEETAYWYCCPFPSVYRVRAESVRVLGKLIPRGHVMVFEYGDDGAPGQFITRASFQTADSRQYCED
ncbi:hypothetical protein [Paenibacillus humicola]|uniref:hypothetical protein n=1 Tax=Paenibacillus humicola TaxID=3110540 RepID=UPI00237A5B39|nr:hypothetical protein [Paenibacillus humicola]